MYVSHAGDAEIIGCKTMFGVEATCIAESCFGLLSYTHSCFSFFFFFAIILIINESFLCCLANYELKAANVISCFMLIAHLHSLFSS